VSNAKSGLRTNRVYRLFGFAAGVLLFYAPFALLIRGVGLLFPATSVGTSISDVHSACLRMPLGWLAQPWMWPTIGGSPLAWLPILVLPLAAVAAGPLFCGWLCPAGALPEYLGRAVPDRFKFDFKGRVDIVPLRYGFFAGFLLAPFVSSSICCVFCNFTHMQNIVAALTGDWAVYAYLGTLGVVAAAVWIVPLGLFTKGGRGWCLFLCPAGTTMAIASSLTARFPWTRRVRTIQSACTACGTCVDVCPMRAADLSIPEQPAAEPSSDDAAVSAVDPPMAASPEAEQKIDHRLCIECFDCVKACPSGALKYGGRS